MRRILVTTLIVLAALSPLAAQAQTIYEDGFLPAPDAYKDLPGVKDPRSLKPKERYDCHTELAPSRYGRGPYRDVFGSRGLPVQGYRCSGDGVTVFGTGVPTAKDWYPGINPRDTDF